MSRKGLMEQDLSKLDVTKLHPLSPEVISRQATINIGEISFLDSNIFIFVIFDLRCCLYSSLLECDEGKFASFSSRDLFILGNSIEFFFLVIFHFVYCEYGFIFFAHLFLLKIQGHTLVIQQNYSFLFV